MRVKAVPPALAVVLMILALAVGLTHSRRAVPQARAAIARAIHAPRAGGRAVDLNSEVARFGDFVVAIVPARAQVRIVAPVQVARGRSALAVSCDPRMSGPGYWWFVYLIAPRESVCDEDARWTVYLGVAPPAEGTVYRFAPAYAVVRR